MSNPHSWYDFMSDRIKALNNKERRLQKEDRKEKIVKG